MNPASNALIANTSGIYGVYSMREVFEFTQYWAIGSGHEFALDKNSSGPLTLYSVALHS